MAKIWINGREVESDGTGVEIRVGDGAKLKVDTSADLEVEGVAMDGLAELAALSEAEAALLDGAGTGGTVVASKVQVGDANQNLGAVKATGLSIGTSGSETDYTNRVTNLAGTSVTIPIQVTVGNRIGVNANGLICGQLGNDAIDVWIQEDNSTATFTDDTADATSSGAGDVAIPDPFDTNDAFYAGHAQPFAALQVIVGTAGAGDAVAAETEWEYWNGSAWAALTEVTDDSSEFTAGASTYLISFKPPSDWATTTVDGSSSAYFVRFRSTADDVYNTTQPVFTRFRPFVFEATAVYKGISMPVGGTLDRIEMYANTISATNDDTELVIINMTQNTYKNVTWTKAVVMDDVSGVGLTVAAGDEIAIQVIQEDGTTEYDGAFLVLTIDPD